MNDLEQKKQIMIEINFPLNDLDIINILKGVEYNQETHLNSGQKIRIKVFSKNRVKHISWENWMMIKRMCYLNQELEGIIRLIEEEIENYN